MIQVKVSRTTIELIPQTRNELNKLKRLTRFWVVTKIPEIVVHWKVPSQTTPPKEVDQEWMKQAMGKVTAALNRRTQKTLNT